MKEASQHIFLLAIQHGRPATGGFKRRDKTLVDSLTLARQKFCHVQLCDLFPLLDNAQSIPAGAPQRASNN
jgi:hypothetical protein